MPDQHTDKKPSEAEVEILQILWEKQPCSVHAVHEEIARFKSVGYTTILKQLQRMLAKGLVVRSKGKGKSYDYSASETAHATQSKLLGQLLKSAFRGDVNELVMHALGDSKTSSEDLDAIKAFISQIEGNANEGNTNTGESS
ncbi:MAG: transcriptional regulator [Robiginitomaculum sp.]|nr:MAG: transcriptional regulator [Robiginitomaculum sp.]